MGVIERTVREVDLNCFEPEYYKCPDCDETVQKHIVQEGARYHVPSYFPNEVLCSETDCEDNHRC